MNAVMNVIRKSLCLCLVFVAWAVNSTAQPTNARFNQLVDQYFDDYYEHHPSEGTSAGFHQYDVKLEDYSQRGVTEHVKLLRTYLVRFTQVDPKTLNAVEVADRELMIASIQSQLLSLTEIRWWERDPGIYCNGVNNSAFILMMRNYAPLNERLQALIAREKQMPQVLKAARANLKNPPRIYTEIALETLPPILSFFQNDLPLAVKDATDAKLQAEFQVSNQAVIAALKEYEQFLQKELLPKSNGDFRIGAELYRKKLLYDEMVDIPLDRLLQVGYQNLHANQEWFKRTAAQIDPSKTAAEILAASQKEHPPADKLLESIRGVLGDVQRFIIDHKIITIPSPVQPIVAETPPFMRATTTASMDTPGPYEKAKEAYYFATLPDPSWPKEKVEDYMGGFTYGTVLSTTIHEAYPGHYTQFLWVQSAPSKVRKLIGCGTNAEGWAHYTEQMMLDEGYTNDPKMRLGQLQDALLRNARYIVGIEMHTGKMTYEQAIEFFVKEGYQSREIAIIESKRGTSDPTYLMYTLGKLAIMKLRADYKAMRGDKFTLQEFHDNFMRQGFAPIKLVRRALLGQDGSLL